MGQVLIKVPQNVNLEFTVKSIEIADEILRIVQKPKKLETITLNLPFDVDEVDGNKALGIWSDREETADEIARKIREQNRKVT
jgi:hypothetical protein